MLRELWARRDFALYIALSNLRSANANTALGVLWWILNPLLLAGVYFLVFGVIFSGGRRGDPGYLLYLLSGLFPFYFMTRALRSSASSLIGQRRLIENVPFPRLILPIAAVTESGVGLLASLGIYLVLILPTSGAWVGPHFELLPVAILLHVAFTLGLGAALSVFTVRLRDIANLLPFVMRLWLYTSPIIWLVEDLESAPGLIRQVVEINPMFSFIGVYRAALLEGATLSASNLASATLWAAGVGVLGLWAFRRHEARVTRYL